MSAAKIAGHATCTISKEFVIELILDIGEILIKLLARIQWLVFGHALQIWDK